MDALTKRQPGAPLSEAERAERRQAGAASGRARHRAETTPSIRQGSSGPPSRAAIALFRQGQARPDTRAKRGVWDTRSVEPPKGAMNATFTMHLPTAYRSETPDPPGRHKTLAAALGRSKAKDAPHQDITVTNPALLVEAHRHAPMRQIIEHAIGVVRDHQLGTIEQGQKRRLIPPGTHPELVRRVYKHAALRALHKAGLGVYDTQMDAAAKHEFRPLFPFYLYAHRRLYDHLNQGALHGKWGPFREQYGETLRQKRHGQYTGEEKRRMKPMEFLKLDLGGDLDLAKALDRKPAGKPPAIAGYARAVQAALDQGGEIPLPPGGLPPIKGARFKHKTQAVEHHFKVPAFEVPRIGGSTQPQDNGLYRVVPVDELEKLTVRNAWSKGGLRNTTGATFVHGLSPSCAGDDANGTGNLTKDEFGSGNYNVDPKRSLYRTIHPRMRRRKLRLRFNLRGFKRAVSGGVTRQDRWLLGAGHQAQKIAPSGDLGKGLFGGIAGAALGGGAAATVDRLLARRVRMKTHSLYQTDLHHALQQHLHALRTGSLSPDVQRTANEAFRAAKHQALTRARNARTIGLKRAKLSGKAIGGIAGAGGALGLMHGTGSARLPPLDQSLAPRQEEQ